MAKLSKTTEKVDKTKEVKKVKDRKKLIGEMRRKMGDITVEILNISVMSSAYVNKIGVTYFDLEPNETALISLEELNEVRSKAKSFFLDHMIIITDVYDEDYTIEDVMIFLSLDKVYDGIDDPTHDFIEDLLVNTSDKEFEKIIKAKDKKEVKRIACKGLYLHYQEDNDFELSRRKEKIMASILNVEELIR